MMNFSTSRQTTTDYTLLLVLLVAPLALVVESINTKNRMANTTPKERKLTEESNKLIFSRSYIAVTQAADFVTLFPNGGDTEDFLDDFSTKAREDPTTFKSNPQFSIQGSSTTQKGAIFDSSSIEVVNAPEGVKISTPGGIVQFQFAGNRKLRFTPVDDPFYFFHGQCIATSGILEPPKTIFPVAGGFGELSIPQPVITSHSCKLNICLGGGGFSCIAIYSGSAFNFNLGEGIVLNNEGIPQSTVGNFWPLAGPFNPIGWNLGEPVDLMTMGTHFPITIERLPFNWNITIGPTIFVPTTGSILTLEAPPLPPPFPGTIIGGTGAFEGIEGSVTIATIAGTTGPIAFGDAFNTGLITGIGPIPKMKTSMVFEVDLIRFMKGVNTVPASFSAGTKTGSIVQVISVKSNMPLPAGP